jgi:hypothetical protein
MHVVLHFNVSSAFDSGGRGRGGGGCVDHPRDGPKSCRVDQVLLDELHFRWLDCAVAGDPEQFRHDGVSFVELVEHPRARGCEQRAACRHPRRKRCGRLLADVRIREIDQLVAVQRRTNLQQQQHTARSATS